MTFRCPARGLSRTTIMEEENMSRKDASTIRVEAPEAWSDDFKAEFREGQFNGCVGTRLLSESDRVRVWEVRLAPGERLPFHRHVLDYFWTATTDGKGLTHYHDGRVGHPVYKAGDTGHFRFSEGEFMIHDMRNVGTSDFVFTTVEFLDSINAAIDVPDSIRRKEIV